MDPQSKTLSALRGSAVQDEMRWPVNFDRPFDRPFDRLRDRESQKRFGII